ncbi:hypothetical protein WA026_009305 [Henosepilachna vigintioctopunctata]|uniref:THAP-type domain-containing protein n=1 Tax=Henosepilachna vigintioctopunctata TaxID=420089 RepID=A0AAW1UPG3_9CUCU
MCYVYNRFPDNPVLKEKWIEATGVTKVTKYTKLCSDHFDENAFVDSDGYTSSRRLRTEAVPCRSTEQVEVVKNSDTENQTETNLQKQMYKNLKNNEVMYKTKKIFIRHRLGLNRRLWQNETQALAITAIVCDSDVAYVHPEGLGGKDLGYLGLITWGVLKYIELRE